MLALLEALDNVRAFIESGGTILIFIAILTFVMWTLMFERFWFYKGSLNKVVKQTIDVWEARAERTSWNAHKIRDALISRVSERINANLDLLGAMVALCGSADDNNSEAVKTALEDSGYEALAFEIGGTA